MSTDAGCVALLAQSVRQLHEFLGRPIVIGISGAPGSGKTTLARSLRDWLQHELGLSSVSISLDDFYLSKRAREDLAKRRHPLFGTRGVPGTHNVDLAIRVLQALTESTAGQVVTLPGFDKAVDDCIETTRLRQIEAPVDVVLFEGWCVGAPPQADEDLVDPVNALEAEEDAGGVWRRYVNEQLKNEYALLFERLDALLMLRVPSFTKAVEWRELQERELREAVDSQEPVGMSPEAIRRFVMHFERLTLHMLDDMPNHADTVIDVDESHRMVVAINNKWPIEAEVP